MATINPAHVTPPPATTGEEAERDKRAMTRSEAERRRQDGEGKPASGENGVDSGDKSASG